MQQPRLCVECSLRRPHQHTPAWPESLQRLTCSLIEEEFQAHRRQRTKKDFFFNCMKTSLNHFLSFSISLIVERHTYYKIYHLNYLRSVVFRTFMPLCHCHYHPLAALLTLQSQNLVPTQEQELSTLHSPASGNLLSTSHLYDLGYSKYLL